MKANNNNTQSVRFNVIHFNNPLSKLLFLAAIGKKLSANLTAPPESETVLYVKVSNKKITDLVCQYIASKQIIKVEQTNY